MEVIVINPGMLEGQSDFEFLKPIVEAFQSDEPIKNFYFPCPENGPQTSTAEISCEYNSDYVPTGIIKFKCKVLEVIMNYHVQITPNKTNTAGMNVRFIKNNNRVAGRDHSVTKVVDSAKAAIDVILNGFRVGGAYRHIVKRKK